MNPNHLCSTWIGALGRPVLALALVACQPTPAVVGPGPVIPVVLAAAPLAPPATCGPAFVTHTLPHTTLAHDPIPHQFETNGAGVAIEDLNADGRLDIVLANVAGPATLLWNEGGLHFTPEVLPDLNARAVNSVDVDGDDRPDLVFTHSLAGLTFWRNIPSAAAGERPTFHRQALHRVTKPAMAMAWGDLNGDNALDVVAGSYDAELNLLGNAFLFSDGAGIFAYLRDAEGYTPHRLSPQAQALAISVFDVTGDHQPDILVGNDFDTPDMAWTRAKGGWQAITPFAATSHTTMNLAWGDIDNTGRPALFATDMRPFATTDVETWAAWLPLMARMPRRLSEHDPQKMRNTLQVPDAAGRYVEQSIARGLDATGWSWSGKFGDLDNDGWLDLYVVNGMLDADLLGYLPGAELVEPNQAFRNVGAGVFVPAPEWGLGSTASGRGLSVADLDNDGRLDLVVNNLNSPAQLFENQTCGGASLEVDLRWPGSGNTRALGARLSLHTSAGTFTREVLVSNGYLSSDPSRVHFGFPAAAVLESLEVRWPDGAHTRLAADQLMVGAWVTLTR